MHPPRRPLASASASMPPQQRIRAALFRQASILNTRQRGSTGFKYQKFRGFPRPRQVGQRKVEDGGAARVPSRWSWTVKRVAGKKTSEQRGIAHPDDCRDLQVVKENDTEEGSPDEDLTETVAALEDASTRNVHLCLLAGHPHELILLRLHPNDTVRLALTCRLLHRLSLVFRPTLDVAQRHLLRMCGSKLGDLRGVWFRRLPAVYVLAAIQVHGLRPAVLDVVFGGAAVCEDDEEEDVVGRVAMSKEERREANVRLLVMATESNIYDVAVGLENADGWNAFSLVTEYGRERLGKVMLERLAESQSGNKLRFLQNALRTMVNDACRTGNLRILRFALEELSEFEALEDSGGPWDDIRHEGIREAYDNCQTSCIPLLVDPETGNLRRDPPPASPSSTSVLTSSPTRPTSLRSLSPAAVHHLFRAVRTGAHDVVRALVIERAVEVDATDSNGRTALHVAAQYGFARDVIVLLDHGADMNRRDADGLTPWQIANEMGWGRESWWNL
ncbi:hypothetical protein HDU96_008380 [Phlyctochytrium bullatum]|nr:hypothetical protein HDU96_008380 [Phlyctochytrium bullatum]